MDVGCIQKSHPKKSHLLTMAKLEPSHFSMVTSKQGRWVVPHYLNGINKKNVYELYHGHIMSHIVVITKLVLTGYFNASKFLFWNTSTYNICLYTFCLKGCKGPYHTRRSQLGRPTFSLLFCGPEPCIRKTHCTSTPRACSNLAPRSLVLVWLLSCTWEQQQIHWTIYRTMN